MKLNLLLLTLLIASTWGCHNSSNKKSEAGATTKTSSDSLGAHQPSNKLADKYISSVKCKALLASRFASLQDFQSVVNIKYSTDRTGSDSTNLRNSRVVLSYHSQGQEVISILNSGLSQAEISKAKEGDVWDGVGLVFRSPYAIRNRAALTKIFILARRRPHSFGEGDVAFFDLAEACVNSINTSNIAYLTAKDSSEKGYLNSFNHITAQAFITSLFTEEIADFIADVHERKSMPELTTGKFSIAQLTDSNNYPVDNYVDMVNNELGQELGKRLSVKYNIKEDTKWTPELLADYMNDIQVYYRWAFGIGMRPFKAEDDLLIRFAHKINSVLGGIAL
jgi:hypothetical protein